MTSSPVAWSSAPVGSSAKTTVGAGDERPRDGDPLRLPAGQLAGTPPLHARRARATASHRPRQLDRLAPRGARAASPAARRSRSRAARRAAGRTGTRSRSAGGAAASARGRTAPTTSRPRSATVPASGRRMPARQCSSVDLPEPDGPMTASDSPSARSTSTPGERGRRAEALDQAAGGQAWGGGVHAAQARPATAGRRVGPRGRSCPAGRAPAGGPASDRRMTVEDRSQTTSATPAATTTTAPTTDTHVRARAREPQTEQPAGDGQQRAARRARRGRRPRRTRRRRCRPVDLEGEPDRDRR